ncbi:MAG: hypothetical protein ACI8T1_005056 [Verrucomicrobiales bacterium]
MLGGALPAVIIYMSSLIAFLALAYPLLNFGELLSTPEIGEHAFHVVTPRFVEMHLINTQPLNGDTEVAPSPTTWDFLTNDSRKANAPTAKSFVVEADGVLIDVLEVRFKRQVIHAPVLHPDLRVGNSIYVLLKDSIPDGANVKVTDSPADAEDYLTGLSFTTTAATNRLNTVLHVNQVGFATNASAKRGYVSLYLDRIRLDRIRPISLTLSLVKTLKYPRNSFRIRSSSTFLRFKE